MTEEQLYELIHYDDEHESQVGVPNEIFEQLNNLVDNGKLKKQHIGLTYTYIYIHYYMARYSVYDKKIFTINELKMLLGYAKDNQRIDYLFKRNGLLDNEGIFYCTNDYPVLSQWEENYSSIHKTLEINFASELYSDLNLFREYKGLTRNQFCKLPIKGFYLDGEWYKGVEFDGLFFSDNTEIGYTLLDFKVFAYCMTNNELGCNAFYLYSYLKYQNFKFNEEFKATQNRIARETKLSNKTVYKYMDAMKSYNMITTIHNQDFFSINLPIDMREASTHKINTYDKFTYAKTSYSKMKINNKYKPEKITIIGKDDYKAEIALSDLPF